MATCTAHGAKMLPRVKPTRCEFVAIYLAPHGVEPMVERGLTYEEAEERFGICEEATR